MARHINPKCLKCIDYSRSEAKRIHGPQGDSCWQDNTCDSKRSHYRNRKLKNARRKGKYAEMKAASIVAEADKVETIHVPVHVPPVALVYLYMEKPKHSHLHALTVSVWQGSTKLAEVAAIHCMGMTNTGVNVYLQKVLRKLNKKYGITEFEPEIRMEPSECEIPECPLKDKRHVHSA